MAEVEQRGNMVEDVSDLGSVSTQQFASAPRHTLAGQFPVDLQGAGMVAPGISGVGVLSRPGNHVCRQ